MRRNDHSVHAGGVDKNAGDAKTGSKQERERCSLDGIVSDLH